jgi:hypothetical protein
MGQCVGKEPVGPGNVSTAGEVTARPANGTSASRYAAGGVQAAEDDELPLAAPDAQSVPGAGKRAGWTDIGEAADAVGGAGRSGGVGADSAGDDFEAAAAAPAAAAGDLLKQYAAGLKAAGKHRQKHANKHVYMPDTGGDIIGSVDAPVPPRAEPGGVGGSPHRPVASGEGVYHAGECHPDGGGGGGLEPRSYTDDGSFSPGLRFSSDVSGTQRAGAYGYAEREGITGASTAASTSIGAGASPGRAGSPPQDAQNQQVGGAHAAAVDILAPAATSLAVGSRLGAPGSRVAGSPEQGKISGTAQWPLAGSISTAGRRAAVGADDEFEF